VAPIIVAFTPLQLGGWAVVILLIAFFAWAYIQSKKPAPEVTVDISTTGD